MISSRVVQLLDQLGNRRAAENLPSVQPRASFLRARGDADSFLQKGEIAGAQTDQKEALPPEVHSWRVMQFIPP
jgi:hypothetical protein